MKSSFRTCVSPGGVHLRPVCLLRPACAACHLRATCGLPPACLWAVPPADVSRRQIRIARSADSVQGVRSLSGSPAAEHAASYELHAKQLGRRHPSGRYRIALAATVAARIRTTTLNRTRRHQDQQFPCSKSPWKCGRSAHKPIRLTCNLFRGRPARTSRPLELFRCNLVFSTGGFILVSDYVRM